MEQKVELYGLAGHPSGNEDYFSTSQPIFTVDGVVSFWGSNYVDKDFVRAVKPVRESEMDYVYPVKSMPMRITDDVWITGLPFLNKLQELDVPFPSLKDWKQKGIFFYRTGSKEEYSVVADGIRDATAVKLLELILSPQNKETYRLMQFADSILSTTGEDRYENYVLIGVACKVMGDEYGYTFKSHRAILNDLFKVSPSTYKKDVTKRMKTLGVQEASEKVR